MFNFVPIVMGLLALSDLFIQACAVCAKRNVYRETRLADVS